MCCNDFSLVSSFVDRRPSQCDNTTINCSENDDNGLWTMGDGVQGLWKKASQLQMKSSSKQKMAPQYIGILTMEIYFPPTRIQQVEIMTVLVNVRRSGAVFLTQLSSMDCHLLYFCLLTNVLTWFIECHHITSNFVIILEPKHFQLILFMRTVKCILKIITITIRYKV